jgi:hypothetical protein
MKVEMAALRPFRPRSLDGRHRTRLDSSRRAAERGPTRRSATSPTSLTRFDAFALVPVASALAAPVGNGYNGVA